MGGATAVSAKQTLSIQYQRRPSSQQLAELRAGIITSVVLAAIIVLLRIYTRIRIVKRVGPDDYLIAFAMVLLAILIPEHNGVSHWPNLLVSNSRV